MFSGFATIKPPTCMAGLGLENNEIPDSFITASRDKSRASQGRLYNQEGWATWSYIHSQEEWFQVEFVNWTKVTGVAIQGHPYWHWWVTKFKLSYSHDGVFFSDYKEDGDNAKVLSECSISCPMFSSLGTGLRVIQYIHFESISVWYRRFNLPVDSRFAVRKNSATGLCRLGWKCCDSIPIESKWFVSLFRLGLPEVDFIAQMSHAWWGWKCFRFDTIESIRFVFLNVDSTHRKSIYVRVRKMVNHLLMAFIKFLVIRVRRLFEGGIYLKSSLFLLMVTEHLNFKKQKHVLFLVRKVIFYIVLNFKILILLQLI